MSRFLRTFQLHAPPLHCQLQLLPAAVAAMPFLCTLPTADDVCVTASADL